MRQLQVQDVTSLREALSKELRLSAKARFSHRLHGVLLVSAGYSCSEVAGCFGETTRTVQRWVRNFHEFGCDGLKDVQKSGRPKKLSREQLNKLQQEVQSGPMALGYGQSEWDGKLLASHIARRYGVVLSIRQCQRFLRQQHEHSPQASAADLNHAGSKDRET